MQRDIRGTMRSGPVTITNAAQWVLPPVEAAKRRTRPYFRIKQRMGEGRLLGLFGSGQPPFGGRVYRVAPSSSKNRTTSDEIDLSGESRLRIFHRKDFRQRTPHIAEAAGIRWQARDCTQVAHAKGIGVIITGMKGADWFASETACRCLIRSSKFITRMEAGKGHRNKGHRKRHAPESCATVRRERA